MTLHLLDWALKLDEVEAVSLAMLILTTWSLLEETMNWDNPFY